MRRAVLLWVVVFLVGPVAVSYGVDLDGDGMSDVWQKLYGIASGDTEGDPDGDGFTNLQEAIAGTDPNDAGSAPRFSSFTRGSDQVSLAWVTVPGKHYEAQSSTDLINWTTLETYNAGEVGTHSLGVTAGASVERMFFRLVTSDSGPDSDYDGLTNFEEHLLGSSPLLTDSDLDGVPDLQEMLGGTSPTDAGSHPAYYTLTPTGAFLFMPPDSDTVKVGPDRGYVFYGGVFLGHHEHVVTFDGYPFGDGWVTYNGDDWGWSHTDQTSSAHYSSQALTTGLNSDASHYSGETWWAGPLSGQTFTDLSRLLSGSYTTADGRSYDRISAVESEVRLQATHPVGEDVVKTYLVVDEIHDRPSGQTVNWGTLQQDEPYLFGQAATANTWGTAYVNYDGSNEVVVHDSTNITYQVRGTVAMSIPEGQYLSQTVTPSSDLTGTYCEVRNGIDPRYANTFLGTYGYYEALRLKAPALQANKLVRRKLVPVEMLQPKLEADGIIASGIPLATSAPRFARWRNGFTEPGGQFKQDWIKDDPDRVIIHLPNDVVDPTLPWVNVKVKGITGVPGRTTDEGLLELTQKNGGWESEPFLFVTDDIDDTSYSGDQGQDNNLHDQTRLASFGAEISIKVQFKGQSTPTEVPMGVMGKARHTVKVELNILEGNVAVTAADKALAQQHFEEARLLYRQIGVDLVQQGTVNVVTLPAGYANFIAQNSFIDYSTRIDWTATNPTGQKFFDYVDGLLGAGTVLKVFYIKTDLRDYGEVMGHGGNLLGWGGSATLCINELDYGSVAKLGGYVTAHEIGHVLGADHTPANYPHCIMRAHMPTPQPDHKDPRRFREADEFIFIGGKYYK